MARTTISGDFGKIKEWELLFETGGVVLPACSAVMAEEAIGLVKDGFRSSKDPYGEKWKRKKRKDGRKVLSGKTSRLKGGWHVSKNGKGGATIAPSVVYAAFHQVGTKRLPARLMVPSAAKGLPDKWARLMEEAAQKVLRRHFKRKGRGGGGAAGGGGAGGGLGGGLGFIAAKIAAARRNLGIRMLIRRAISRAARDD